MLGHKKDQRSTVNKYYLYWPLIGQNIPIFLERQNFRVDIDKTTLPFELPPLECLCLVPEPSCCFPSQPFLTPCHNIHHKLFLNTLHPCQNNLHDLLWTLWVCDLRNSLHSWGCFKRLSKIWIHSWPGSHNWSPLKLILGWSEGKRLKFTCNFLSVLYLSVIESCTTQLFNEWLMHYKTLN